jgi:hypothetical protein
MPIYTCDVVGSGMEGDPIRSPFSGEDSRIGWINLAPPQSALGRGILYLPEPSSDRRLTKLCELPHERLPAIVRRVLQNSLGITLHSWTRRSVASLIAEVMREHGEPNVDRTQRRRWGTLLPSKARQRYEIYLGELGAIWTEYAPPRPATQTFTESWPTVSTTLSSGQDQPWTELLGDLEVVAGTKLQVASGTLGLARCDSSLDTSNQYHQASFTLADDAANNHIVTTNVRMSDNNNWYRTQVVRNSGGAGHFRVGEKRVAGVTTNIIANSASDPGASGVVRVTIDGSTMTIDVGSYNASGTDGTPQLLTNVKGGCFLQVQSGVLANASLAGHTIGDVVPVQPIDHLLRFKYVRPRVNTGGRRPA